MGHSEAGRVREQRAVAAGDARPQEEGVQPRKEDSARPWEVDSARPWEVDSAQPREVDGAQPREDGPAVDGARFRQDGAQPRNDGPAVDGARFRQDGGRGREQGGDQHRWRVLVIVLVGSFMAVLDTTIVNVALPSIGEGTKATSASLEWVVSG